MKNRLPFVLLGSTLGLALLVTLVYYWASFFYQQEHREVYVSVILKNTDYSNDFWNVLKEGIVVASADYNVKYEIRGPKDEREIEEQLAYLEEAISKKPDAIILAATDFNRFVPLAKEIKKKQIPLIVIDSLINSDDADCKISTDNYEAGNNAGKLLLKYLQPGAPVAIFSFIQSCSTAIDRERGIISYLKDKVKIIEIIDYQAEEQIAYLRTKQLLVREPYIKGLAALNLPGTIGCAKALKESGRAGEIVLIGFDSSPEVIEYLQEGVLREIVVQKPFNMGYLGIRTARELIDGKPVKSSINTGSESINKENMFLPENQKLLFPVKK